MDGGFVADGEFVVARRDPSGPFEEPNPAFGCLALYRSRVEAGRAAAGRTPAKTVASLVALLRDDVRDLPATEVLTDLTGEEYARSARP